MKVAIKFCGGCDPTFDRVEYANKIKDAAAEHLTWVDLDNGGKEAMIVICGCPKACPMDVLQNIGNGMVLTSDNLPPEVVVDRILRKG